MHLLALRKAIPELTLAGWAWCHRGTLLRTGDLALQVPTLLVDGRTDKLATEARAVLALDAELPDDMSVRIGAIEDGTLLLRGDPGGPALRAARRALKGIPSLAGVQTEAARSTARRPVAVQV